MPNAVSKVKQAVDSISKHLDESGLELAPENSKLCVFRKESSNVQWDIELGGVKVKSERVVKFLGTHLHASLDWGPQVRAIIRKCQNTIKILSCLGRTWWGADPMFLISLYKALIFARIEYGAFLFHNLKTQQGVALDRIQFKAIRIALGYRKSTPTNIILAEANEPPLTLRFKNLCRNYLTRVFANTEHKLIPILERLNEYMENPVRNVRCVTPDIVHIFREHERIGHQIANSSKPHCFSNSYDSLFTNQKSHLQRVNGSKSLKTATKHLTRLSIRYCQRQSRTSRMVQKWKVKSL